MLCLLLLLWTTLQKTVDFSSSGCYFANVTCRERDGKVDPFSQQDCTLGGCLLQYHCSKMGGNIFRGVQTGEV